MLSLKELIKKWGLLPKDILYMLFDIYRESDVMWQEKKRKKEKIMIGCLKKMKIFKYHVLLSKGSGPW